MTTDDRELLDELRSLSQALGPFADGIFADSLSAAEQRDFGDHLIKIAARIQERAKQKPFDTPRLEAGDLP
ncbi:MAG TPA: hypothetical protein VFQ77_20035 [Pseudonocardiaceae bacterium]|nr:hypothetical protein [Pseudonocardiaceae bacterium]